MLYPVGWSSEKVKSIYCGEEASAFNIDQCSLGESEMLGPLCFSKDLGQFPIQSAQILTA